VIGLLANFFLLFFKEDKIIAFRRIIIYVDKYKGEGDDIGEYA